MIASERNARPVASTTRLVHRRNLRRALGGTHANVEGGVARARGIDAEALQALHRTAPLGVILARNGCAGAAHLQLAPLRRGIGRGIAREVVLERLVDALVASAIALGVLVVLRLGIQRLPDHPIGDALVLRIALARPIELLAAKAIRQLRAFA